MLIGDSIEMDEKRDKLLKSENSPVGSSMIG